VFHHHLIHTGFLMSHSFAIRKLSLGIALTLSTVAIQTAIASTCPFDGGGSDAINDGIVLTRYALGITGAPLVASTRYASLDPLQVKNNIECVGCVLDMNGDGQIDTVDTTIIARHLIGFSGTSLTNGLALGAGSRNTTAAVTSFLVSGCAVGGTVNAWTLDGNAFGTTGVMGTTDNNAFEINANNERAARSEPGAQVVPGITFGPNITLGHPTNVASSPAVVGGASATVSRGGRTSYPNKALGVGAAVSGGVGNTAVVAFSVIAGGTSNTASGQSSAVMGGSGNSASGSFSGVLGGNSTWPAAMARWRAGQDPSPATKAALLGPTQAL
jgi:hypothetical protein